MLEEEFVQEEVSHQADQFEEGLEGLDDSNVEGSEQVETEAPATTQNAFRVKYNSEEIDVPYEEAPDYIQKGMNYDKVHARAQEAEQYQSYLNRVMKLNGYETQEQLLNAMDEYEREQERAQYEEAGIDPDKLNEILENHPDMQYAKQMRAKEEEAKQYDETIQREIAEFKEEFPDLDEIPNDVLQLKEQKGLTLLDAYLRINYKNLAQQKEQEVINKIQKNQLSSTGSLGQGGEHKSGYSQMSPQEKAEFRKAVKNGEVRGF